MPLRNSPFPIQFDDPDMQADADRRAVASENPCWMARHEDGAKILHRIVCKRDLGTFLGPVRAIEQRSFLAKFTIMGVPVFLVDDSRLKDKPRAWADAV